MKDNQLLRLLRSDPNAGMAQLIDLYAGLVYSVIRGRLAGSVCVSSDIEDAASDVFSEFYLGLSRFDPGVSSIKSFLCVMARNKAVDVLRRRQNQLGEISLDDESNLTQIEDETVIDSDLEASELRHEVFAAIEELGEPDSGIIIRKYYLGETSKEIASALGLSVSNVDTRAHRALKRLRTRLGGYEK